MSQTKTKKPSGIPIMAGLIKKLGQENYQELAQLFESARADNIRTTIEKSEDKFEKRLLETKIELKDEITAVRTELKDEITAVRTELKDEITAVRIDLKDEIKNSHQTLIRWMITLWVTNTTAIIVTLAAVIFKA